MIMVGMKGGAQVQVEGWGWLIHFRVNTSEIQKTKPDES